MLIEEASANLLDGTVLNVREKPREKLRGGGLKLRRQLLIMIVLLMLMVTLIMVDDKCDDDDAVVGIGNQLSIFEFRVKQNRVKPSF